MIRIIALWGFTALFALAETCNFSSPSQRECEIDITNPPLMLHKFVRADGSEYAEYRACASAGNLELGGRQLEVLDCSMVESKDGTLTEGVTIEGLKGKNLIENKSITIKQDNVLLRVAGDLVIDSGVRINVKNPANLVIEIIEGTNTRSNLILQRGALLNAKALVMPEGSKSSVWMNTYYGGIYEREFIDLINHKDAKMRGEMETLLSVDEIFALSRDGEEMLEFNGNIFCGPEVNPLDWKVQDYTLKRLFSAKDNSNATPSEKNAQCNVKEGGCFENISNFDNRQIANKSYKVATAGAKILPTYDIFIESGKIISSDGKTLTALAPKATIEARNYGKCEVPTKVAFEKSSVEEYLAYIGGDSAQIASLAQGTSKDSAQGDLLAQNTQSAVESIEATKQMPDSAIQDDDIKSHSPIQAEMQAELDENLQDLLMAFGMKKEAERLKAKPSESKDSKGDVGDSNAVQGISGDKDTKDSAKTTQIAGDLSKDSMQDSTKAMGDSSDSTQDLAQKDSSESSDGAKIADSTKATQKGDDSTQIAQDSSGDSTQKSDSSDSTKIADATDSAKSAPKADLSDSKDASDSSIATASADTKDLSTTKDSKDLTDSSDLADDSTLKDALLAQESPKKPARTPKPAGKDEFLIVEREAYEKLNKECYGDLKCLADALRPYDGLVWSKKSSKERVNTLYVVNIADDNLKLDCEVRNYYGKNIKKSYSLSHTNTLAALDMKFATSQDRAQVLCKTRKTTKATNKIITTPAKFDLQYGFVGEGGGIIPTLKAGRVRIEFKESRALTLEGDVDNGFNGNLAMSNLIFTQKNKCDGKTNGDIFAPKGMDLRFRKGYLQNAYADLDARTVAFGRLNIDFAIPNNDKTCSNIESALSPQCVGANIAKDISIIPANFRVKTDILDDNGINQIAYYGQIDDKHTFKYNPLLSLDIEVLDSNNKPININKACNYGSIELSLKSDKLIEFKRSSSDRLNSRIVAYLRDFERDDGTSLKAYFGISKIVDKYKNSRTIAQSDVAEPSEVTLMDFKFNVRFRNGTSHFDYDNLEVYDRLDEHSNPLGILFVRGKLQTNDIKGDLSDAPSLIAKYAIYCKSCDKRVLAKYLQGEPEIESQFWYINTKHPSGLYLSNSFIRIPQKSEKFMEVKNSNEALEGRQEITFKGKKGGIYPITIAQRSAEFAPYLNYNEKYKNTYIANNFSVMISDGDKDAKGDSSIFTDLEAIKKSDSTAPAKSPSNKSAQKQANAKSASVKSTAAKSVPAKSAPKSDKPSSAKSAPKQATGNIWLDIED